MGDLIYWFANGIVKFYLKLFRKFTIYGTENIPQEGSLILAGNHTSAFDPPIMGVAFPKRKVRFMAKKELFKPGFINWFLRQLGAFPINRGRADIEAMKTAFGILREGGVLGVFPEGTRQKVGEIGKAQPGAIMIALKAKAPILPCGLSNASGGKKPVIARFGKPIYLDDYYGRKLSKEEVAEVGELIMNEIGKLVEMGKDS